MSASSQLVCPRCGAAVDSAVAGGICPACLLRAAALGTGADSLPSAPWVPPTVDELAPAFPQLEILELVGHGGMGAVYKARQKSLGRLVALKILAPQHAANPDFAERFSREAQVLAEVNHPNIVTVHDFGRAGDFYFLLMEFVDGVNLRQAMTAGRLTPQQALAIVPPICEALQFAHDRGIVHRDIKPENLLLDKEGRIKIADFGIARMLRGSVGWDSVPANATAAATGRDVVPTYGVDLTQESVLGTPQYMAPEQREHPASVDHRADIFSLGVVLYEMLTGELPGATLQAPSRKVQIDVRLDEIVLRALDVKPELRFSTAAEFRQQVEAVASSPTRKTSGVAETPGWCGLKTCNCCVTTRERLATLAGQLFLWRSQGQMLLDDSHLTIKQGRTNTVIPLAAIQGLSIGRYPALVNPAGLDLISVTYEAAGQSHQLFFSPYEFLFGWPSKFNQATADWFEVIREATIAATGRAPARTSARDLKVPGSSRWGLALFLISMAIPETILITTFVAMRAVGDRSGGLFGIGWPELIIFGTMGFSLILPVMFFLILRATSRHINASKEPAADPSTGASEPRRSTHAVTTRSTASDQARPNPAVNEALGFHSQWAKRFLGLSHLGFLGFLCFVPGLERVAGMFGFFGFLGIATLCELWVRYPHWPLMRRLVAVLSIAIAVALAGIVAIEYARRAGSAAADVFLQQATVDQGHFSFLHDVKSSPGWNVWLTLENAQLFKAEDSAGEPRGPVIVSRYQAKLAGKGRVRVPLEYQPTSDEERGKMLASIGPWEGHHSTLSPNHGVSVLAYQTESLMEVWAILTILPEGQTPDSLLDNPRSTGSPRFKTIQSPGKVAPFEGASATPSTEP